jgi:signal transduction histidine kinase
LQPVELPSTLQHARIVLYGDRHDRLWIGVDRQIASVVVRHPDGRFEFFGPEHDLPLGSYRTFYEDARGALWLSGNNKLIGRLVDNRFQMQMGRLDNSRAMIEDHSGRFWISAGLGILSIDKGEFDAAYQQKRPFDYESFDRFDGVAGTSTGFLYGDQSVARAADGRLWFVTGAGITLVDPNFLRAKRLHPSARLDDAAADGKSVAPASTVDLSPGLAKLEIFYGALNLTSPHKTRFKYMLEGFDTAWIDAGTRRQVAYTNLPPRPYRFRLLATTGDSANESVATWGFAIRPALHQRGWFWPMCILLLAAGIWAAWRMHLQRVQKQFVVVLGERARLSREIHDTLLQGLVGVALQFDVIAHDLNEPKSRDRLKRIQHELERYVREARQAIWDLRSLTLDRSDLVTALREACEYPSAATPVKVDFSVTGTPQRCSPRVEEQLLHIAREGMANAVRHAQAKQIGVKLEFGDETVTLRVTDDGCGFDPNSVPRNDGHVGLSIMRERAATISGTFRLNSIRGRGTETETVVPLA